MLIHCVKHVTGTPFLLHQSEENFVRLFFISVLHFEKLMETGSTERRKFLDSQGKNTSRRDEGPCPNLALSEGGSR